MATPGERVQRMCACVRALHGTNAAYLGLGLGLAVLVVVDGCCGGGAADEPACSELRSVRVDAARASVHVPAACFKAAQFPSPATYLQRARCRSWRVQARKYALRRLSWVSVSNTACVMGGESLRGARGPAFSGYVVLAAAVECARRRRAQHVRVCEGNFNV